MLLLSLLIVFKEDGGLWICTFSGLKPMIVDMWLLLSIDSQSVEEARDIFPSYCGNMVIGVVGGEVNPPLIVSQIFQDGKSIGC